MNRLRRKQLRNRYRQAIDSLVGEVTRPESPPLLKDELQELEAYSKLLELSRPVWTTDSGLAIFVVVLCISVAGLLWSKKVSYTDISMTAETESLAGVLGDNWSPDRPFVRSSLMRLEGLSKVSAPGFDLKLDENYGNAWISVTGERVSLEWLEVGKGAEIQIATGKNEVTLFVSQKPLRGRVTIVGSCAVSGGNTLDETSVSRHYKLTVPETVEFEVIAATQVTSRITVHTTEKWDFKRIPFANLTFAREEIAGPAENKFTSGAKGGTIRFNDTSWTSYEIHESELWSVPHTEHAIIEVRSADPLIHIILNGPVKSVVLGSAGTQRELASSYLEYLYNKKSLTFFWGSIVCGWGTLWGIRKTVFR